MKKNILIYLSLLLVMSSCEEVNTPSLSISQSDISVSFDGGSHTIKFNTNMNWTASSSEGWCSVSPANGNASTENTITITVSSNQALDNRNCIVTITAGTLSETITIIQSEKIGILIHEDDKIHNLNNDAHTLEIEVKSNIDYYVNIAAGDDWISEINARGLSTNTLKFDIAKNNSYDNREGIISIKQKDGELSSTIKVFQSQLDTILLSQKIYNLSSNSHEIEIELKTNVEFDVIIPDVANNWISESSTRLLSAEKVILNITANESDRVRTADVVIKNIETNLQETLAINQNAREPGVYWVDKMGTLGSILNQTQKDTITTMIIKGEINNDDFKVINEQMTNLQYLDLEDVKCEGNKIPRFAFYYNKNISSIHLPLSIKVIEEFAFSACTNLTGPLIIPDSVNTIGGYAFSACLGLTGTLSLPKELTSIGNYAFYNCSGFTGSLYFPEGLISIGEWAFNGCSGFTGSLEFPANLKSIGGFAFANTKGFSGKLSFPDGLISIGKAAFEDCSGFTDSLVLPSSIKTIGERAFNGCSGFTGPLKLPEELTTLGQYAFSFCSGLNDTLSFPDGLATITSYAFAYCHGINSIVFGNNLTTIFDNAFINCSNISGNVVFPVSLNSIRNNAFLGCNNIDAFRLPHATPPPHYPKMFPEKSTVKVPLSSVDTYKSTDGWNNYNIVGY